ncbi:MAG: CesT family type III secretion system chaperone [Kiritimatiellae bacterium]|nr:CesT family type III secretion system chaperone [Kiritimatiellia bacterium]
MAFRAKAEDGVCELVVRESFGVSLKKSEEDGTLTMFSSLGADLPNPVDYPLVLDLLEFNLGAASGASCAVGRNRVSTPCLLVGRALRASRADGPRGWGDRLARRARPTKARKAKP